MKTLLTLVLVIVQFSAIWAQTGDTRTGCLSGNCKNGRGTYRYTNGDVYIGKFAEGFRWGDGLLVFADGDSLSGSFREDTVRGVAVYRYTNGDLYKGEIINNRTRDGKGDLISRAEKTRYIGYFSNNMPHGKGIKYLSDGTIERGEYNQGNLVTPEPFTWTQDTTGETEMCKAYRGLAAAMPKRYTDVSSHTWNGEKGMMSMPTLVLPGAIRAYIFNVDSITTIVNFELLRSASQEEAERAYNSMRKKLMVCKPVDFHVRQNDNISAASDIAIFLLGNKRPKNSVKPGFATELRSMRNPDNTYNLSIRMIAYEK